MRLAFNVLFSVEAGTATVLLATRVGSSVLAPGARLDMAHVAMFDVPMDALQTHDLDVTYEAGVWVVHGYF